MKRSVYAAIVFLFLLTAVPGRAQGCAQCRDNAAATPPKTQAAYRHAITLLVVTASSVFLGTVWMLKKQK